MFLSCLDPKLRKTVVWQVFQLSLSHASTPVQAGKEPERRPHHHTDPIEFETLLKVSEGLVHSVDSYNTIVATSTYRVTNRSSNRTQHTILQRPIDESTTLTLNDHIVQLLEDMNASMAVNTDVLINIAKENGQQHGETTKSMETMHTLLDTWHRNEPGKPNLSTYQAPTHHNGCFYGWAVRHYIADCEFLAKDVAEQRVETQDGGAKVDMRKLPKEPPNVSPKDQVDRYWRARKQFVIEELPEDLVMTLALTGLVTLQTNLCNGFTIP